MDLMRSQDHHVKPVEIFLALFLDPQKKKKKTKTVLDVRVMTS